MNYISDGTPATYNIGSDSYAGIVVRVYDSGVIVKLEHKTCFVKKRKNG